MLDDDKEDVLPEPFLGVVSLPDTEVIYKKDGSCESAAIVSNPNKEDDRKLFQARITEFEWDVSLPYEMQPNRLREECPSELLFPDHFYQCEGGVVIIYWEKDRDCACIGTIVSVKEVERKFLFRSYGWKGKSKQT